ncbi:hypothetical protein K491DRAFT_685778 [Lophiostoma macrostomum CBS 122681]|uniref:Helicase C-terminal domain-containing protein n=1 Tax=Lophiostoma macrostomum CBS 122681 TaxID=1314788 RepID=A0A6A6SJH0_9PLEO|nr:hypothetical protein K491DRAFT_685778 [Lophiostoma macrostomum CBS 122681]
MRAMVDRAFARKSGNVYKEPSFPKMNRLVKFLQGIIICRPDGLLRSPLIDFHDRYFQLEEVAEALVAFYTYRIISAMKRNGEQVANAARVALVSDFPILQVAANSQLLPPSVREKQATLLEEAKETVASFRASQKPGETGLMPENEAEDGWLETRVRAHKFLGCLKHFDKSLNVPHYGKKPRGEEKLQGEDGGHRDLEADHNTEDELRLNEDDENDHGEIRSPKIECILKLIYTIARKASAQTIIVFSNLPRFLDILEEAFRRDQMTDELEIKVSQFDGRGSTQDRILRSDSFRQQISHTVTLITPGAGGATLEAQHVIQVEPWWNAQMKAQAYKLVHRLGEDDTVQAWNIKGTNCLID